MKKVEIYDPAMCCSSGVCGTDVDPKLVQFASDVTWAKEQGVKIERFGLSQHPAAFASNKAVQSILATEGTSALPIILVDGSVMMKSSYPTREQLALWGEIETDSSCCCSSDAPSGTSCC